MHTLASQLSTSFDQALTLFAPHIFISCKLIYTSFVYYRTKDKTTCNYNILYLAFCTITSMPKGPLKYSITYTFALSRSLDDFLAKFNGTFSSKTIPSSRLKPRPKTGILGWDELSAVVASAEELVRVLATEDEHCWSFLRWMLFVLRNSEADNTAFGSLSSEIKLDPIRRSVQHPIKITRN